MREGTFEDWRVECPFYRGQDRQYIRCEGLTRRGSLTLRFARAVEKKKWLETYCEDVHRCEGCVINRMLETWLDT